MDADAILIGTKEIEDSRTERVELCAKADLEADLSKRLDDAQLAFEAHIMKGNQTKTGLQKFAMFTPSTASFATVEETVAHRYSPSVIDICGGFLNENRKITSMPVVLYRYLFNLEEVCHLDGAIAAACT